MAEIQFVGGSSLKADSLVQDWITFPEQGVVRLTPGKVDIGQGISTALAQIAADELRVDMARLRVDAASTRYSPDEGVTSGSFSVQQCGDAIRRACATIREAAIAYFSSQWGVAPHTIRIADGRFVEADGDRSADYWALPATGVMPAEIDMVARPLAPADLAIVGRSTARIDLPAKVFGEPVYIHDIVLPGMLHGRIVRRPNLAAELVEIGLTEDELGQRYPGVRIVRDGNLLGVLSPREEHAVGAAAKLAAATTWRLPPDLPDEAGLDAFLRTAPAITHVVTQKGEDGQANDATFSGVFSRPFLAHASIAPSCALAHWTEDGLEVWSHSQGIYNLRTALQAYIGTAHPGRVGLALDVHHAEGAGCYGHNPADDVAFDAVMLAQLAEGRPVRVLWSRADELSCGPLGPAQVVAVSAWLSSEGNVHAWQQQHWANGYTCRPGRHGRDSVSFLGATQLASPFETPVSIDPPMAVWGGGGDRNSIPQYDMPHLKVEASRLLAMPIRTSALRALGGHPNVFAIESTIDELALAAGRDPVEFRLAHLSDPRARAVIERAVADAAWWGGSKAEGEGHGLAYARYKHTGAWCAVALRLMLDETIRVTDACAAVDVGMVVNPDGVRNQIEGGLIQSCSWTLKEAVHFSREEIITRSWEDYPILTFSETPAVSVSIIDRPEEPSVGSGEAATGPTAAAIGNAVRDALGVRVMRMPITFDRIMELLV
jgi:CO/xanthine dehydrogenase Mo-binding subunit